MNKIYLEFTINVPELRKKKGERGDSVGRGKKREIYCFHKRNHSCKFGTDVYVA